MNEYASDLAAAAEAKANQTGADKVVKSIADYSFGDLIDYQKDCIKDIGKDITTGISLIAQGKVVDGVQKITGVSNPGEVIDSLAAVPLVGGVVEPIEGAAKIEKTAAPVVEKAVTDLVPVIEKEATVLYRAVNPQELADIVETGIFRNAGSAEGKYFTTSAENASSYAKQAVNAFGDEPYTIIKTNVSPSIFNGLTPAEVDRGIPAWVIPSEKLTGLTPVVMDSMPIPKK